MGEDEPHTTRTQKDGRMFVVDTAPTIAGTQLHIRHMGTAVTLDRNTTGELRAGRRSGACICNVSAYTPATKQLS